MSVVVIETENCSPEVWSHAPRHSINLPGRIVWINFLFLHGLGRRTARRGSHPGTPSCTPLPYSLSKSSTACRWTAVLNRENKSCSCSLAPPLVSSQGASVSLLSLFSRSPRGKKNRSTPSHADLFDRSPRGTKAGLWILSQQHAYTPKRSTHVEMVETENSFSSLQAARHACWASSKTSSCCQLSKHVCSATTLR